MKKIPCSICGRILEIFRYSPKDSIYLKIEGEIYSFGVVCNQCQWGAQNAAYKWAKEKKAEAKRINYSHDNKNQCTICRKVESEKTKIPGPGYRWCHLNTEKNGPVRLRHFCADCDNGMAKVSHDWLNEKSLNKGDE
jgi:hypothetical protein